ncbi:8571_t:CDS:1, partial [Rhizophagus irregularis]
WSNWSRKFGFSSKPPKNTDDNLGMNSVDSVTSSVPSPKKSRWSNLSILNYLPGFEIIDTIDEEIGIPSTSTQNTSTTNTTPTTNPSSITDFTSTTITKPRPFRCVVNESRDSQDTLVEIKVDKRQVYF